MLTEIEAYTGAGVLHGRLSGPDRLADLLETLDALALDRPTLEPIDGGPRETQTRAVVETDDLLLVVCPPGTSAPVHARSIRARRPSRESPKRTSETPYSSCSRLARYVSA